jgi:hypothetical protein
MDRRIFLLPLLALAGTSLSGCVAVAVPALAGSAIVGTRIDGDEPGDDAPSKPAPAAAAVAARSAPALNPTVTVMPSSAAQTAMNVPAPAPAPVSTAAPIAVASPQGSAAHSAPSAPTSDQRGFAQFVRYGRGVAAVSAQSSGPLSAMLSDPIALDGQRKRCDAGEQPVAVIDLDPADSLFAPPASPAKDSGRALGLAVLREAGVQIAWLSDLPVSQVGAVRTALEAAGLDPRGEDIVSLRRDPEDRKQARKEALAATSCIIAIAGDTKPDFDERFQYLRNPEAGAALETAIGDGWFLIEPVFPVTK